jgi:hypothetical protein
LTPTQVGREDAISRKLEVNKAKETKWIFQGGRGMLAKIFAAILSLAIAAIFNMQTQMPEGDIKLTILIKIGDEFIPVQQSQSLKSRALTVGDRETTSNIYGPFKAGDKIQLKIESRYNGYLYIINVAPSGDVKILFPRMLEGNRIITASESLLLGPYRFNEERGVERLNIVMSSKHIEVLDAYIEYLNGNISLRAIENNADLAKLLSMKPASSTLDNDGRGIICFSGAKRKSKTPSLLKDSHKEKSHSTVDVKLYEILLDHR